MIKAHELRLGNCLLLSKDGKYNEIIVNEIKEGYLTCHFGEYCIVHYAPIPLTPEILEKCGFVKEELFDKFEGREYIFYKRSLLINGDQQYLLYSNDSDNIMEICVNGSYAAAPKIKYIHQLQNLYFELKGEELDIKL